MNSKKMKETINLIIKFFKHNKYCLKLSLVFFVVLSFFAVTRTYSKYIINGVYEKFLVSKEFFFYSNSLNGENHNLHDWNGIDNYVLSVDLENYIDELRWTEESIPYVISVLCDPNITGEVSCSANNGTLNYNAEGGTSNKINISMSNSNSLNFNENDYVDMEVTARSTSPYSKTLSASFRINVKKDDIKYSIKDSANQSYLDLVISNNSTTSKSVLIGWNYEVLSVDNTNDFIISGTNRLTTVNGKNYVNGSTISIEGKKVVSIRFYKADKTQNYTYPIVNVNSIITVS